MANPIVHSEASVKNFGGDINDYIKIHEKMDCSKGWIADNRHRCLTHTMFWIKEVMVPIFGSYITNSDEKKVSVAKPSTHSFLSSSSYSPETVKKF